MPAEPVDVDVGAEAVEVATGFYQKVSTETFLYDVGLTLALVEEGAAGAEEEEDELP